MKITRDGKEYELTSDELYNAYIEQEGIFDRENIENNMELYLDEEAYELLKDNDDFIEEAAQKLRRNQDKYDMNYEYALSDAFQSVKKEFLKEPNIIKPESLDHPESKYVFDDEIIISDDKTHLEGYIWATDALVARLKNELQNVLSEDEIASMDIINFYPVYDISNHTIDLCGHFYYWSEDKEIGKEFQLSLNDDDTKELINHFEAYCQEQEGKSCLDFLNTIRSEEGLCSLGQQALISDILPDILPKIKSLAEKVRHEMTAIYGDDLAGHCIEASERIVQGLSAQHGLAAKAVEGWCRFDDECYGSDHPWDPHTWVELPSLNIYVDITADQFNYGMAIGNEFSSVVVQEGLPHGMQYEQPTWCDFDLEDEVEPQQEKEALLSQILSASTRVTQSDPIVHTKAKGSEPER